MPAFPGLQSVGLEVGKDRLGSVPAVQCGFTAVRRHAAVHEAGTGQKQTLGVRPPNVG